MPVMDGYETLAALAADPALRHIPVIVITGVDELDSVVRCLAMGAADYLPKTVDPAILQARIASSLARKRLHDAEREAIDKPTLLAPNGEPAQRREQDFRIGAKVGDPKVSGINKGAVLQVFEDYRLGPAGLAPSVFAQARDEARGWAELERQWRAKTL